MTNEEYIKRATDIMHRYQKLTEDCHQFLNELGELLPEGLSLDDVPYINEYGNDNGETLSTTLADVLSYGGDSISGSDPDVIFKTVWDLLVATKKERSENKMAEV